MPEICGLLTYGFRLGVGEGVGVGAGVMPDRPGAKLGGGVALTGVPIGPAGMAVTGMWMTGFLGSLVLPETRAEPSAGTEVPTANLTRKLYNFPASTSSIATSALGTVVRASETMSRLVP